MRPYYEVKITRKIGRMMKSEV